MANSTATPKWVTIYLWFTVLLTVAFCATGYFSPGNLFTGWGALSAPDALSLAGPLGLFLARNIGTAAATTFGLLQKNASVIQTVLILRIVTDGMDCVHNLIAGNMPVAIFGGVMCLIEIFAFFSIKK